LILKKIYNFAIFNKWVLIHIYQVEVGGEGHVKVVIWEQLWCIIDNLSLMMVQLLLPFHELAEDFFSEFLVCYPSSPNNDGPLQKSSETDLMWHIVGIRNSSNSSNRPLQSKLAIISTLNVLVSKGEKGVRLVIILWDKRSFYSFKNWC